MLHRLGRKVTQPHSLTSDICRCCIQSIISQCISMKHMKHMKHSNNRTTTTTDNGWRPCRLQMPTPPCGRDLVSAWITGCCRTTPRLHSPKACVPTIRRYNMIQYDTESSYRRSYPFVKKCQKLVYKAKYLADLDEIRSTLLNNHCICCTLQIEMQL